MVDDQVGERADDGDAKAVDGQHGRSPVRIRPGDDGSAGSQHHDERDSRRQEDEPNHRDFQMRSL